LTRVVVDASTALAWCFPDETSADADNVLVSLEGKTILVPAVWGLEIANAVLAGERKKRLAQPEIRRFTVLLESLSLVQDVQPVGEHIDKVLPLARKYNLSAYDAAYWNSQFEPVHRSRHSTENCKKRANQAGVKRFVGETGLSISFGQHSPLKRYASVREPKVG
jgi:predicted nucleic acid-binding protein